MTSAWTSAQVLTLAPDSASAKAGQALASSRKWTTLGRSDRALWGECPGSAKQPYRVQIDLSDPAFKCTCPSRKFPCKHALGLFLLFINQPAVFSQQAAPAWVSEWLNRRDQQAGRQQARAITHSSGQTEAKPSAKRQRNKAKAVAQREATVTAGLAELELWLHDLIRQGLAAVQTQPSRYWENMAARMVDAQSPGIARWLREMSSLPSSGSGWSERLLARLGLLYLLLEGFKRIDTLPPSVQADIRAAIGWTYKEEELLAEPGVTDTWLVLARRVYEEDRLRVQRIWLWGQHSRRAALVLDFAFGGQALDVTLTPGFSLEAELVYFPSNYPLRALVKNRRAAAVPLTVWSAYPTIAGGLAAYGEALARQPWLEIFPFSLEEVVPLKRDEQWMVRDRAGQRLRLNSHFDQDWRLLAVSGGETVALFGEWDGQTLLPLSVWAADRLVPLGGIE